MMFLQHLPLVMIASIVLSLGACKKESEVDDDDVDRSTLTNCRLASTDKTSSIGVGFPRNSARLKADGEVIATVIMVDFSDSPADLDPEEAFEMISGATDTFTEMSYGRFEFKLEPTYHWYRMSKKSTNYRFNTYDDHHAYIKEAVKLADDDVDFAETDLLVVLSNPKTTGMGEAGPTLAVPKGGGITADGNEMLNAVTSGHDINTWGSIWLNHETGHALGLVDLYAFEDITKWDDIIRFTGDFSYMGFSSFTSSSPGLTAWERWLLGWLDTDQIACVNPYKNGTTTKTLTPIASEGGTKAMMIPLSETKVAVVESRRATGIDKNLPKTGALVYTVDTALASGKGPLKVYPSDPSSDPHFRKSIREKGESVSVEGLKFEVLSSDNNGDKVRVSVE